MHESKFIELKGETDNSKINCLILAVDRTRQKKNPKTKKHTTPPQTGKDTEILNYTITTVYSTILNEDRIFVLSKSTWLDLQRDVMK